MFYEGELLCLEFEYVDHIETNLVCRHAVKCFACNSGSCRHIYRVNQGVSGKYKKEELSKDKMEPAFMLISKGPYPPSLDLQLQSGIHGRVLQGVFWFRDYNPDIQTPCIIPIACADDTEPRYGVRLSPSQDDMVEEHIGSCCDNPEEMILFVKNRSAADSNKEWIISRMPLVILLSSVLPAVPLSRCCLACELVTEFDGQHYNILNYNNEFYIGAELMYELLECKVRHGVSTDAWWNVKVPALSMEFAISFHRYQHTVLDDLTFVAKSMKSRLSNLSGRMHQFFMEFTTLIVWPPTIFQCCDNPDIVGLDGTVISTESSRIRDHGLEQPWIIGKR